MAADWWDVGYVQDPADKDLEEWTQNRWHLIKGHLRLHLDNQYGMMKKKDNQGVVIYGVSVPDLSTLKLRPSIEFTCDISTSNVVSGELVSKALLTHRGEHPVALYAALYTQQEWDRRVSHKATPLAEFKHSGKRPPVFTEKHDFNLDIKPDSGIYVVDWSITRTENDGTPDRQSSGTVASYFYWDSKSDRLRDKLRAFHNI